MMKNASKIIYFVSTLTFSTNLFANPYVSIEGGVAGRQFNSQFFNDKYDRKPTGRFAFGFTDRGCHCIHLGLEGGVQAFRRQDNAFHLGNSSHRRRTTLDALGVIDVYFAPNFDLYGKAGIAYVHQSTSIEGNVFKFSHIKNAMVPEAMIGVGFDVSPHFNLNLTLSNQFARNNQNKDNKIPATSSVMLGVKYIFA